MYWSRICCIDNEKLMDGIHKKMYFIDPICNFGETITYMQKWRDENAIDSLYSNKVFEPKRDITSKIHKGNKKLHGNLYVEKI